MNNDLIDKHLLIELGASLATTACLSHGRGRESHRDGYLLVTAFGQRMTISRAICWTLNGPPPTPSHQAAHSCGWSECIVGSHLEWKPPIGNQHDRIEHGTAPGDVHRPAVRPRVRALIGWMAAERLIPQRELADMIQVSERTVSRWATESAAA